MDHTLSQKNISIIGAGAWATALALVAHHSGARVRLWTRNPQTRKALKNGQHPRLPGVALPGDFEVCDRIEEVARGDIVMLGVSAQAVRATLMDIKPHLKTNLLVAIAKGIENETGALLSEIAQQVVPHVPFGLISGPNFAIEVAQALPAATTFTCPKAQRALLKHCFKAPFFRLYHTEDAVGVQLGGALKNVIAIGCGFIKALNLGENARVAFITRAMAEIQRLGVKMGAAPDTFFGLSGVGDMMLTCMGTQSRNLIFGQEFIHSGAGEGDMPQHTVEGYHTAKVIHLLQQKHGVEMPLCEGIYDVLFQKKPVMDVLNDLMNRREKSELNQSYAS